MNNFVQFELESGRRIYINLNEISHITESREYGFVEIAMTNGNHLNVKGTYEKAIERVQKHV